MATAQARCAPRGTRARVVAQAEGREIDRAVDVLFGTWAVAAEPR